MFCKCPDRERLVTSDRSEVIRQKTDFVAISFRFSGAHISEKYFVRTVISTCGSANMTVLPWDNPDFLALGLAAWATDTGHLGWEVSMIREGGAAIGMIPRHSQAL